MIEKIIYSPEGESPEKKQSAKDYEEKARRESERRLHVVPEEEAKEFVKVAEKSRKGSIGVSRAEMKDWWEGKEKGKGARDSAETLFDYFHYRINLSAHKPEGGREKEKTEERDFIVTKEIKPSLEDLAKDVILHGAQEDVLLYLMDEWRPQAVPEVKIKIWDILQDYLKEEVPQKDKEETGPNPDHRLYAISKEEAREWVEDIEKVMKKKISGENAGELKKWWMGESGGGVEGGAEKLADFIFNQIAHLNIFDQMLENEQMRTQANENFEKHVGPHFRQLIEGVVQHGAQENIWQYFWDEWAPRYNIQISYKVWEFYKNYFEKSVEKI